MFEETFLVSVVPAGRFHVSVESDRRVSVSTDCLPVTVTAKYAQSGTAQYYFQTSSTAAGFIIPCRFFCVQYTEKRYRVNRNELHVKCIFCLVHVEFLSSVEVY